MILLLLIALLLFGAKRLPEIGRSLGTGMREFKDSVAGRGGSELQQLTPGDGDTIASVATQEFEEL